MLLTKDQLKKCVPDASDKNIDTFYYPLNFSMETWKINTPLRIAGFLAQVAHESGSFKYVKELASGEAYDTGRLAERLGNTPEKDGDGQMYKGRGLIQITGKYNYYACSNALFNSDRLLTDPWLLELPEYAAESACWFWSIKGLNSVADNGDLRLMTKIINGGSNGYEDRESRYNLCKQVFNLE